LNFPDHIQAITFDVGGTLIEPWPSVGHVYAEIATRHGIVLKPSDLDRQFQTAWRMCKNFGYTLTAWSQLVDRTFEGLTDIRPSESFFDELYRRFSDPDVWRIHDDVLPTLTAVRRRGLRTAAISNWDERLRPLLAALKLDTYFDAIEVSSELGCHKPERKIFVETSNRLNIPALNILHIGDSMMEDFEGARAAGFEARLLNRAGDSAGPEMRTLLDLAGNPLITGL